jgi:hypothetical protein
MDQHTNRSPQQVISKPQGRKISDELVSPQDSLIMGVDKNIVIMASITVISIGLSLYLFKEFKKIRDDVRILKGQGPDDELIEKVEQNSESVKAIEMKLDQLILALGARERSRAQQAQAQAQQLQQAQQAHAQVQAQQQQLPQLREQEYQNQQMLQQLQQNQEEEIIQVPVMGGRIKNLEDPGIIKV